jgi:hypothetical protein
MRKYVAATAFALVAFLAARAQAADKLRLERMDLRGMPTLKLYLSLVDHDGRVITGKQKEEFRLSLDSGEQGSALTLQSFDETKEPINVVFLVELGQTMNAVIEDMKRGIGQVADALPPKSKAAIVGYAGDTKRISEQLGAPADVESASKSLAIDADSGAEMHLLDALSTAVDMLQTAPKNERKLIIVFSDGINQDMEPRIFTSKGKRAGEAGIVIDTIGYTEFDPSKLRNLGILSKQSQGSDRVCKSASDISNHFNDIIDEIKKQYVATFETVLAGGDNKNHDFQALVGTDNPAYSNTLTDKLPARTHPPKSKGESHWLMWLLIVLGVVGLGGLVAWLVLREKPEKMEAPEEQPAPAAAPQPAQPAAPMKTMALNVSAVGGGAVAVGWIVATNGKYADQTFKLKPSRTLIGTGADCDVKVEDQFMSSHHCEVRFENGNFKLCDLGSTNGIVVNDKKVREHELVDNDQFRLGRTEFKFKSIS